jgi:S1-C subfamily serine protease
MLKLKSVVGAVLVGSAVAMTLCLFGGEAKDLVSEGAQSFAVSTGLNPIGIETEDVSARLDARRAAVRVITPHGQGSGTYLKIGRYYVVITAQHVVNDEEIVIVEGRNNEYVIGQPILHGTTTDVSFILVPEINSREALDYRPMRRPRNIERLIGREVTYTGFPSHHDLLSVDGQIVSVENGRIVIHSYAWPGASGSGVFDMRGRFIGVVSAVDIGIWNRLVPPALVEDIVWIAPVWDISEDDIKNHLRMRGD